jgi:hypothetical protein
LEEKRNLRNKKNRYMRKDGRKEGKEDIKWKRQVEKQK